MLGLERHLELQERKKKLEEDKKERENELFDYAKKYDERAVSGKPHYTIPQPFAVAQVREFKCILFLIEKRRKEYVEGG